MDKFEKEYLSSDWTSETKFLITGGAGGDLSVHKGVLKKIGFLS